MTSKQLVSILVQEAYLEYSNVHKERLMETPIEDSGGIIKNMKHLFNKLDKSDKKVLLQYLNLSSEETILIILSIIDQWGGGYFNDGQDSDGHFELYYVSDEEGKYKYRVDEDSFAYFSKYMELLTNSTSPDEVTHMPI